MVNEKIKEIMSSEDNLVKEINENGFDIFEDYKIIKCDFDNGLIKNISFELQNNPLDTDWDYNGCITLLFNFNDEKIKCQIQCEAITDKINYSDFAEYKELTRCIYEFDDEEEFPKFENEECDWEYGCKCNFSKFYDTKYYKNANIFKKITEYTIKCNENIMDCINTQLEIEEFEREYYENLLEVKFDKPFDEITDDELYALNIL